MDFDSIGKYIKMYRQKKKITQEQLSETVDISVSYLSMLESANKRPSLPTLIKIANALGVSADMLLCDLLENRLEIRRNLMLDEIAGLPEREQERIFAVIDVMIEQGKK